MLFVYLLAEANFWIAILSIVLLGCIFYCHNIYNHLNRFPAPPFHPIIGHALNYRYPENVLPILTNDLIKHNGIIRQYIGPAKPSLIVANREFLEVLWNNRRHVYKSKFYDILKPWLGEGLITSDGYKWKMRRRILTAALMQTGVLKAFINVFEKKANILISILEQFDQQEIDVQPILKRYTFDIIFETAMGIRMNQQLNQNHQNYINSIDILNDINARRMVSLFKRFQWIYNLSNDSIMEKRALSVIDAMFNQIMEIKTKEKECQSESGQGSSSASNLLELLMEIEIDGEKLTRSDLREEVNTFIFAGYDTTAAALAFILYTIADNVDVQQKLFEEQIELFKPELDNRVTYEILMKMEYLDIVIKETLRIYPVVPLIGKRIIKDIKYGDCQLPAMLNFIISAHGFHNNPNYFPEPNKFIPERFLNDVDQLTYIPFGVKPRQCLGKNFAILEIKCAISKIIRNFQLFKTTSRKMALEPKLVLHSKNGVWIKFVKRK